MPPKKQFEERFLVPLTTEMLAEIDRYLKPGESRAQLVRDGIKKELEARRQSSKSTSEVRRDYIFEEYLKATAKKKMSIEEWYHDEEFDFNFSYEDVMSISDQVAEFEAELDQMREKYVRKIIMNHGRKMKENGE